MKTLAKALVSIVCFLVALIVIALGAVFVMFDPNKHRDDIAAFISKSINRPVELAGEIELGLSAGGLVLTVNKVAIANPEWASRKTMVSIGAFEVGVALLPLLEKKISITSLSLQKVDVRLETASSGKVNWELGTPPKASQQASQDDVGKTRAGASHNGQEPRTSTGLPVSISVDEVRITDSVLSMRSSDGKLTEYGVKSLVLVRTGKGLAVELVSQVNGMPMALKARTTETNFESKLWPFEGNIDYATYKMAMAGSINLDKKTATLDRVHVMAGESDLSGNLVAAWGGKVPVVRADFSSQKIAFSDFKIPAASTEPSSQPQESSAAPRQGGVLSREPLPFEVLKTVEAEIKFTLDKVSMEKIVLKHVSGGLSLRDGHLSLNMPKILLGDSALTLRLDVDASARLPVVRVSANAPQVKYVDLQSAVAAPQVVTGMASADLSMAMNGTSPHDLAASANGALRVLSQGGQVSLSALGDVFSGLAQLVAPGAAGVVAMNCLAVDMSVRNGVIGGHGLLLDTPVSTAKLSGDISLGQEQVQMLFEARPKSGNVGKYIPPVRISGGLKQLSFGLDERAVAGKVVSALLGGGGDSNVPVPQGGGSSGNACLEAMHRPVTPTQTSSPENVLKNVLKGGEVKPKEIGKQLLRGLLGN